MRNQGATAHQVLQIDAVHRECPAVGRDVTFQGPNIMMEGGPAYMCPECHNFLVASPVSGEFETVQQLLASRETPSPTLHGGGHEMG